MNMATVLCLHGTKTGIDSKVVASGQVPVVSKKTVLHLRIKSLTSTEEGKTMFNSQHWQIKLVYATFGLSMCTIIGMLLSPVTAQKAMETIQCSRLEVVDAEGTVRVTITTDEQGGVVTAYGKNGHSEASLRSKKMAGASLSSAKMAKRGRFSLPMVIPGASGRPISLGTLQSGDNLIVKSEAKRLPPLADVS